LDPIIGVHVGYGYGGGCADVYFDRDDPSLHGTEGVKSLLVRRAWLRLLWLDSTWSATSSTVVVTITCNQHITSWSLFPLKGKTSDENLFDSTLVCASFSPLGRYFSNLASRF
jgi:hypothetical protein